MGAFTKSRRLAIELLGSFPIPLPPLVQVCKQLSRRLRVLVRVVSPTLQGEGETPLVTFARPQRLDNRTKKVKEAPIAVSLFDPFPQNTDPLLDGGRCPDGSAKKRGYSRP